MSGDPHSIPSFYPPDHGAVQTQAVGRWSADKLLKIFLVRNVALQNKLSLSQGNERNKFQLRVKETSNKVVDKCKISG